MQAIDHHLIGIRLVRELLPALGIALPASLAAYSSLEEGDRALNVHQALSFHRELMRVSDDPLLALKVGSLFSPQAYGMFGFATMSAPTLRASLEFVLHYQRLSYTLMTLSMDFGRDYTHFSFTPTDLNIEAELRAFFADRDLAAALVAFQPGQITDSSLTRVTLVHDGRGHRQAYRDFFNCDVVFGAKQASLVFPSELLDLPLPYRNAGAFEVCRKECDRQLERLSGSSDLVDRVRQELLNRPGYLQDIESIARQMHVSPRTLRRRLDEQGASFQQLQQAVRFQQAKDYLQRPGLSVREVASLLGYSEPGNFSHAFSRWSGGQSPREFRRVMRAI